MAISKNIFGEHVGPLSDERKSALRTKLSNLKLLVIGEVSMVSNLMQKYIHERLKEIYSTPDTVCFDGISIVVVGDFYQLPSAKAKPAFSPFKNELFNLSHPWKQFRMVKLMKIMRQQGDHSFTDILNRIRLVEFSERTVLSCLEPVCLCWRGLWRYFSHHWQRVMVGQQIV